MRGLVWVLAGCTTLGGMWIAGAMAASLAEPMGGNALAAAVAVGVALCIVLPLALSRRIVRALEDRTPRRGLIHATSLLLTNGALVGILVAAAPELGRTAIESHGDWPLFDQHVPMLSEALAAHHVGTPASDVPAAIEAPQPVAPDVGESEPPPPPEPMEAAGVFGAAADAVVVIETESPAEGIAARFMPTLRGHGSGFAVGPDLVVSNFHVAGNATSLAVRTRSGERVAARRVASLAEDDLVLLQLVDATPLPPLELASQPIEVGAKTWAIGAPLGLEYSLTEGIVSGSRDMSGTPFLQMQTTVAPGSSGGPLLDAYAHVVGVNTAVASPGLSLAVHVERVDALLALARDVDAEALPLLPPPITLVHADFPEDMLPTDRHQAEGALETVVGMISSELQLSEATGRLELAPDGCEQEGLATSCDTLREELGMAIRMLSMLPATIEATFTDVPHTNEGTSGELTLVLHPTSIPSSSAVAKRATSETP